MSSYGIDLIGGALDAFQTAENTVANNIANVSTPGASRQVTVLNQAAPIAGSPAYPTNASPGTSGDGVTVTEIQRIHDDSLDGLYRGASASQNYYTTESQVLTSTQSAFGEPSAGVSSAYAAFQTAISQVSAQPTSSTVRQGVITAAQTLATTLNTVSDAISTQQQNVVRQATANVKTVNGILDQIASLNGQIRSATAAGSSPNTYADQRDYLIDQLSTYASTQTSVQADGSTLVTIGGQAVVNDEIAYHLAPPVIGTSANGTATFTIGFETDPNPSNPKAISLGSGILGAEADVYNNKLTTYGNSLNGFAASLANEVNRVTQSGYDENGQPGAALFVPAVAGEAVTAGDISVGITNAANLPTGLATTEAGKLTVPLSSGNSIVDPSARLNGNTTLNNPPASAGIQGTLSVVVDGTVQLFSYDTNGSSADSIDDFMKSFNADQFGVTASYDTTSQEIVFSRDPTNISLAHRAEQGSTPPTASFTIIDSNATTTLATAAGAPATSLLQALGAIAIASVPQNASNAFGSADNGDINALTTTFGLPVGVPPLQTTSVNAVLSTTSPTVISSPTPGAFANIQVGQLLTVDAQPGGGPPQENVTVTAVNRITGTITAQFQDAHAAGFSITTAQSQTLGTAYGNLVAKLGLDTSTASAGETTQTSLTAAIDATRQSVDGINVDEETQSLLEYQNAYAAAAKTLNVLNQLIQTVLTDFAGQ
jgi:flagellar hook-associated protein 1 FlgK